MGFVEDIEDEFFVIFLFGVFVNVWEDIECFLWIFSVVV